ncbi:unnamed protein product [Larinioides sclopetarius]|uniref:Uncharacterized protein n=1 Tax=Larinioides sclopetarius TaxID=280406 RepID=A0AAV1ZV25_9ARAC
MSRTDPSTLTEEPKYVRSRRYSQTQDTIFEIASSSSTYLFLSLDDLPVPGTLPVLCKGNFGQGVPLRRYIQKRNYFRLFCIRHAFLCRSLMLTNQLPSYSPSLQKLKEHMSVCCSENVSRNILLNVMERNRLPIRLETKEHKEIRMHFVQQMKSQAISGRLDFALSFLLRFQVDNTRHSRWTRFHLDDTVKIQNCHIWGSANPHAVQ